MVICPEKNTQINDQIPFDDRPIHSRAQTANLPQPRIHIDIISSFWWLIFNIFGIRVYGRGDSLQSTQEEQNNQRKRSSPKNQANFFSCQIPSLKYNSPSRYQTWKYCCIPCNIFIDSRGSVSYVILDGLQYVTTEGRHIVALLTMHLQKYCKEYNMIIQWIFGA